MGAPIIRYEAGQTAYPFEAMTNGGDFTVFEASFFPISNAAGFESVVAPYGLLTGGAVTPHATANQVAVAALTASMAGAATAGADGAVAVSAGAVTITRAATNVSKVNSITVDAAGALAAVAGVDGTTTAFVETRGAAGGPPLIPVGSIEIGQVRTVTSASAGLSAGQIYAVPGLHVERSDYPVYALNYATGEVTFAAPLQAIHTGTVPKKVYIKGATPLFAPIPQTSDWVPAESTYSISSTSTYDGPVGSSSASLGQASFTAILKDGITDTFLAQRGKKIWIEFRPDRDKTLPKQLTQGILGVSRTFPAGGGSFTGACTVTPEVQSLDVSA
jgi:hypothetical protein